MVWTVTQQEHVENNTSVRGSPHRPWIVPENLPPAEDTKASNVA